MYEFMLLGRIFPDPDKGKIRRTQIMESAAIAAYHQQTDFPVVEVLLSDGAPQFRLLTREQALCWVHDGRPTRGCIPWFHCIAKSSKCFVRLPSLAELIRAKRFPEMDNDAG